ncbi:MAG: DUF1064 domain-containing protein [Proteobacteria bacterium]|nr:DUF1064 domain-containing protein [Pseudomonadota bacterium]
MRKYRNIPVEEDGIRFDSKKERNRYLELKILKQHGIIANLELQPSFQLTAHGFPICKYRADFSYQEKGKLVVEDVKSKATITPVYRLKKKLMKAEHGIEIREVGV